MSGRLPLRRTYIPCINIRPEALRVQRSPRQKILLLTTFLKVKTRFQVDMPSSTRSASFSGSYESSDHEYERDHASDQEPKHDDTRQGGVRTTNGHIESATAPKPHAYSDQKHLSNGKNKTGPKQKRLTHFVCFPLVTDASVPQLAESLRRFREVTTAPPQLRPSEVQRQQREHEIETPERESPSDHVVQDPQAETDRATIGEGAEGESAGLKVIPQAAHRPPGTFHLTIGAMDLSEKEQLQRALKLLKSIDYEALFRDSQMKQHQNGASSGGNGTMEVMMDTTKPETSNSSSSTVNASTIPAQHGSSKDMAANGSSYHSTVSRIDRAVMQATPDVPASRGAAQQPQSRREQALQNGNKLSPSHSYTNGGMKQKVLYPDGTTLNNTTDIYGRQGYKETVSTVDRYVDKGYNMKERMKQRVKHPLKSLKRNVSPPPSVAGRRLLSGDSSRVGSVGDAGSLRTTTTNQTGGSGGTERPKLGSLEEEPSTTSRGVTTATMAMDTSKPEPFLVTLKGLGAFQSAKKARVFYAPPVDPEGTLLAFGNAIRQVFKVEGLVTEDRALMLHATVANMTYAQKSNHHHGRGGKGGKAGKGGRRGCAPRTIDGMEVIDHFNTDNREAGGYVWAENVVVDRVRICKMGAEKSDDETLGMVYRAVDVDVDGQKQKAEVVFA